jgi:hypothetical protein
LSNEDIPLAKKIFLKYGGSHFQMEREGEYQNYKSFGVSKEQENIWLDEYKKEILTIIEGEKIVSSSFFELVSAIIRSKDMLYFRILIDHIKKKQELTDSFSQVLMAEHLLRIVESFEKNNVTRKSDIIKDAKRVALDILNLIIKKPITVDLYYKNLDYLQDSITEEQIISRVKETLKDWN